MCFYSAVSLHNSSLLFSSREFGDCLTLDCSVSVESMNDRKFVEMNLFDYLERTSFQNHNS